MLSIIWYSTFKSFNAHLPYNELSINLKINLETRSFSNSALLLKEYKSRVKSSNKPYTLVNCIQSLTIILYPNFRAYFNSSLNHVPSSLPLNVINFPFLFIGNTATLNSFSVGAVTVARTKPNILSKLVSLENLGNPPGIGKSFIWLG